LPKREELLAPKVVYRMLGNRMRVLERGFVGRRWELQALGRILRWGRQVASRGAESPVAGATIVGMKGQGKSCLVGRALERFSQDVGEVATVVLHGKLSEFELLEAFRQEASRSGEDKSEALCSRHTSSAATVAMQFIETLTTTATMKMMLPRSPPAAPIVLGTGLVVGSGGVMMGTQIIVSAEWVERLRRLVQAGVLSVPAVSAAVRIQAGQVLMMSQGYKDLPQGVRDALGEGPEVQGMHETGRAGAGMGDPPQHHVLSREYRAWFEQRGFKGDMDIDQFCVDLELAHHQAIHGGGNWRLGRMWPGEWNRMVMEILRKAETRAGRLLTRNEILRLVAKEMKRYNIPMNFKPWRGR
jgi:hypothetical protein